MALRTRVGVIVAATAAATAAMADEVTYTLENVVLQEGSQMFGTFSWTYTPGDFENGTGVFSFLDIPYTAHDHTDLLATIDVGSSIEIVLEGDVDDDGVDITLFLEHPLTPDSGASIDLSRSAYEIGGNGFHTGVFLSGEVVLEATSAGESPLATGSRLALSAHPNPFNPSTRLNLRLDRPGPATVTVHDAAGRTVATLLRDVALEAGEHELEWNGRNDGGKALPTGVYLCCLRAGDLWATRKLTLLK